MPKVVALTGTLTYTGEDGIAAVLCGDISDKLLNQNGFADARAAKQSDFAALDVRSEQIDNLDTCFKHLHNGALVGKLGRFAVDFPILLCLNIARVINRFAQNVKHSSERCLADRHLYAAACRGDLHTLA